MVKILKTKSIWFNDFVIIPKLGKVRRRKEFSKEFWRFVASPMNSVVGQTFAKTATDLGITVCIPRFLGIEKESNIFYSCSNKNNLYCSMGLNDKDRIIEFNKVGCKNFLIDIASGYLPHIEETVKLLVDNTNIKRIILGNIVNHEGYIYLNNISRKYNLPNIIRCGLSNGSGCETYSQTGIGRGAASELWECYEEKKYHPNSFLASDGGLKDGGYVSKALLSGADYCFIGGIFAHSLESETHISGDSTYFGLASEKNQILSTGKKFRHSEGIEYKIDRKKLKPLSEIVNDLWGCVTSSFSYSGFKPISEGIGNGTFEIKLNSLAPRQRY